MNRVSNRKIADQPNVITPEMLSSAQRSIAEDYKTMVELEHGVLVGAVIGKQDWDIRPLVLENGVVNIIRVSNPNGDAQSLYQANETLVKLQNIQNIGISSCGVNSFCMWQKRPFYKQTLAHIADFRVQGLSPNEIALELFKTVEAYHAAGVVHGNLSLSNIAIENGKLSLMDFLFTALDEDNFVAPELQWGFAELSPATDIYCLGVVYKELLESTLSREQIDFILTMLDPQPEERPTLDQVASAIFNRGAYTSLEQDELRLGRVIGRENSSQQKQIRGSGEWQKPVDEVVFEEIKYQSQQPDAEAGAQNIVQEKGVQVQGSTKKSSGSNGFLFLLAALIIGFCCYRFDVLSMLQLERYFSSSMSAEQYQQYWSSGLSERMKAVARDAVDGNIDAQMVIFADAVNGEKKAWVQNDLLRISFDSRWQDALTNKDRIAVLKLATSKLLPKNIEPPRLDAVHPGVLFAIMATLPLHKPIAELDSISTRVLTRLPDPIGSVFDSLGESVSLSDVLPRALVKLFNGDNSPELVDPILEGVSDKQSLYTRVNLLRANSFSDAQIINGLKQSRGAVLKNVEWLNSGKKVDWSNKSSKFKLDLIMGELDISEKDLKIEDYADLLKYPELSVRETAAAILLKKFIDLKNKETIATLITPRNHLDREQTVTLVPIFTLKEKVQYNFFTKWFENNPDLGVQDVIQLMISRSGIKDNFNVSAVHFLKYKDVHIANDLYEKLTQHTDPFVRIFAYTNLDESDSTQVRILMRAYENEKDPKLRSYLEKRLP